MGERATGWRTSFSLDLTWSAVHLAVHSPECLPPDPRQPSCSVFRSAGDDETAVVMITKITKVYKAPWGTAESSPSEWLLFRRRFQATGRLPKAEISGFHLENSANEQKNRVAHRFPAMCMGSCCHAGGTGQTGPDQSKAYISYCMIKPLITPYTQTRSSRAKYEPSFGSRMEIGIA